MGAVADVGEAYGGLSMMMGSNERRQHRVAEGEGGQDGEQERMGLRGGLEEAGGVETPNKAEMCRYV